MRKIVLDQIGFIWPHFYLFRRKSEYPRQELQQFCLKIHLIKAILVRCCTKVWKMPDVFKNKFEEMWVNWESVSEGAKPPSQTHSLFTQKPSILFLHISGIFQTFVPHLIKIAFIKWIFRQNCCNSCRGYSDFLLNK